MKGNIEDNTVTLSGLFLLYSCGAGFFRAGNILSQLRLNKVESIEPSICYDLTARYAQSAAGFESIEIKSRGIGKCGRRDAGDELGNKFRKE